MNKLLRRKIDSYLATWKNTPERKPLIIKGARQIGKTRSIEWFASQNYKNVIQINFVEQPKYKSIFEDGFEVDAILKNISYINPEIKFVDGDTLFFFDELQACPNCATSLKFFKLDGRFDVICSGSLMGINYREIESNSVGFKEDYEMHSMDFEEFLWAKGYTDDLIEELYRNMMELKPLSKLQMELLFGLFRDYVTLGGMPEVVNRYIQNGNFSGTVTIQQKIMKKTSPNTRKGWTKARSKQYITTSPHFWPRKTNDSR